MNDPYCKYIVFCFDTNSNLPPEHKTKDGVIVEDIDAARRFIKQSIQDLWADKFIVARVYKEDLLKDEIQLFGVETFGFLKTRVRNLDDLF